VDTFLETAQRIFDVARADISAESSDFTLLVRPDGSLHVLMEQTVSPESAAADLGAQPFYSVSRSRNSVTVSGRSGENRCELTAGATRRDKGGQAPGMLLRDQPLYLLAGHRITSPLRISSASTG